MTPHPQTLAPPPHPSLGIILDPLQDGISEVELIQYAGDDKMIVMAARVSYGKDKEVFDIARDRKLLKYLLKHGHTSTLEHTLLTFRVTVPIYIDRQMVRHRHASKNEESGRYIELKERCYRPVRFRQQAKVNKQASVLADENLDQERATAIYKSVWKEAYIAYNDLLELGVAREQARGVLPLALYTSSYYTFNMRSFVHFLDLRLAEGAQWEIQKVAQCMRDLVIPLFPETMSAYQELAVMS